MFCRNLCLFASVGAATVVLLAAASPAAASGQGLPGRGASNARSAPAEGGAVGTLDSLSGSGFVLSTPTNQKVSVVAPPATTYRNGSVATSASALHQGASVLVLGTVNGSTITASQVIVQPASAAPSLPGVVPFGRGAPSPPRQVGQIPANYTQGSGTIVAGTEADQATAAALAAYPGGIVDRVVKLSDGEYEVHNIGVNWPHHIFVTISFQVVGAF